jgi:UDP-N-acetyl-L-fucosamine synthase
MKVLTLIGTRPEIIKLSRVIPALDRSFDHLLVHTGQNFDYELNEIFFKDLALRPPDRFLEAAGEGPAETIAKTLVAVDRVLEETRPDALLVLGDTNSCLGAIAAKRRRIPVFHMEAGNRCFDQRVPEEINRVIIDHVADINLPYTEIAREYLLREGLLADRIIKTGSPMREVLAHYLPRIERSDVLGRLGLSPREFFLVSCHREENVDAPRQLFKLAGVLNALRKTFGIPVIVSTHPRTRKRLDGAGLAMSQGIELLKPLAFTDYVQLQRNARAILSDSGTITEEASILNLPALNIREAHERPEGMEEAAVIMTGLEWEQIRVALGLLEHQGRGDDRKLRLVRDYEAEQVSEKIPRLIVSYSAYVRRTVWHE